MAGGESYVQTVLALRLHAFLRPACIYQQSVDGVVGYTVLEKKSPGVNCSEFSIEDECHIRQFWRDVGRNHTGYLTVFVVFWDGGEMTFA